MVFRQRTRKSYPEGCGSVSALHEHWWSMFALVIVLGLVALAGFLLCGIGAAITIPIASAALMYVYEDLFGTQAVAIPES